jgi:cyclopropane fatty-acyl-phospholipid synthase-like methyltransferase
MGYQSEKSKFYHDRFARELGSKDLQKQIRRTIKGETIPEPMIDMILDAIRQGLLLTEQDCLLELACGNGALSQSFAGSCKAYLGTDISEFLIEQAKAYFEKPPGIRFEQKDALDCLNSLPSPQQYNKLLCYAAFQYFPDAMIIAMLKTARKRFPNMTRVFIGNLPDLQTAHLFYKNAMPKPAELKSDETPIGIWRTPDEFQGLCLTAGWMPRFTKMPEAFYASAYRYDVILERSG